MGACLPGPKSDSHLKPAHNDLNRMTTFTATPLRISTMTVTGDLGAIPDLRRLYDHAGIIPYWWIGEGIIKIEYAGERKGQCMEDILHVTTKEKKRFFNQSSLVFRLARSSDSRSYKETGKAGDLISDCSTTRFKETNIKLFKNGGFQMTGINSEEMARAALTRLIAMYRDIWPAEADPHIKRFDTCLINSDYALDKAIHRDNLYHILVEEYGLWSTYDPTRYQGVNAKFFWNKMRPADAPPGICLCPTPCSGDGSGYAIGDCKKITIAPFRTGKIIITGAKFMEQLEDTYQFINGVFAKHATDILRDPSPDVPEATVTTTTKSKRIAPPLNTAEALVRQRMRASPRNIVRFPLATD
jgi:TATA-box binding protein (TBP) (component of TFIID and TFIIIB)